MPPVGPRPTVSSAIPWPGGGVNVSVSGPVDRRTPPTPVANQFEVPVLPREAVLDETDAMPGTEPIVQRSQP